MMSSAYRFVISMTYLLLIPNAVAGAPNDALKMALLQILDVETHTSLNTDEHNERITAVLSQHETTLRKSGWLTLLACNLNLSDDFRSDILATAGQVSARQLIELSFPGETTQKLLIRRFGGVPVDESRFLALKQRLLGHVCIVDSLSVIAFLNSCDQDPNRNMLILGALSGCSQWANDSLQRDYIEQVSLRSSPTPTFWSSLVLACSDAELVGNREYFIEKALQSKVGDLYPAASTDISAENDVNEINIKGFATSALASRDYKQVRKLIELRGYQFSFQRPLHEMCRHWPTTAFDQECLQKVRQRGFSDRQFLTLQAKICSSRSTDVLSHLSIAYKFKGYAMTSRTEGSRDPDLKNLLTSWRKDVRWKEYLEFILSLPPVIDRDGVEDSSEAAAQRVFAPISMKEFDKRSNLFLSSVRELAANLENAAEAP